MKEMFNILGWLGKQEEHALLRDAQKHVEETRKTVAYFADAVKALIDNDLQARATAIQQVRESEHQADLLKVSMLNEITNELLMPPNRDDFVDFVHALDRIADRTNGAAKLIGFLDQRLPDNVLANIATGTNLIVNGVARLDDAIKAAIKNDLALTRECCIDVGRIEHDADDQKRFLLEAVLHAPLDPPSLLLCYNLAEYLEGITDRVLEAADLVRIVAARTD